MRRDKRKKNGKRREADKRVVKTKEGREGRRDGGRRFTEKNDMILDDWV